jgi:hypothetical protein
VFFLLWKWWRVGGWVEDARLNGSRNSQLRRIAQDKENECRGRKEKKSSAAVLADFFPRVRD